jgi:hypothetical protein
MMSTSSPSGALCAASFSISSKSFSPEDARGARLESAGNRYRSWASATQRWVSTFRETSLRTLTVPAAWVESRNAFEQVSQRAQDVLKRAKPPRASSTSIAASCGQRPINLKVPRCGSLCR